MDHKIKNIATQLHQLVEDKIRARTSDTVELKNQVEEATWKISDLLREARDLSENYKAEGLTYAALDAEGYLRGVLTAKNLFDDIFQIQTNAEWRQPEGGKDA